jgi:mRNA interferase HicA
MTGNELLRKLKRFARTKGIAFEFDPRAGKGGHGQIILGDHQTALRSSRSKEIPSGTLRKMLSDLGIDPQDLR